MSTHDLQLGNDPWDDLEHWCERRGFEIERLQPDQLAEHVEGLLEAEHGVEAVRHRLEAIGAGFQERGMDDLTGHSLVWECLGEAVSAKTSSSNVTAADSGSPVGVDLLREPGVSGPDVPSAPVVVSGLVAVEPSQAMPPVLAGHDTPELREAVHRFYSSVQAMFEAWLARRQSPNTRRAYRRDVLDLVEFLGLPTVSLEIDGKTVPTMDPKQSWALLQVTVPQIQAWRDFLHNERNAAPNTLNRRVSSVSGFYKFMREAAAEARLPINVPNPAHSQFISREVQEPVTPTEALSSTRARQLMSLPEGESVLAYRDRAVLKFYLYTGCRIGTGCRLNVEDFVDHDDDPKLNIQEKGRGKSKRAVGINALAADALREYIERAGLSSGPLFRSRLGSKSKELGSRAMDVSTMYRLLQGYLVRVPRAMKEHELEDGTTTIRCEYTPHSIRATTATLLLDAGEDIREVQKLLGHKHVTVTQVYDKRRRGSKDSASHRLSL